MDDGLVQVVADRSHASMSTDAIEVLEKARSYGADYVFFQERGALGGPDPIALIYLDDNLSDLEFALLHRKLWSWGRVPLVYRKRGALVSLFRCGHRPDFWVANEVKYRPFQVLDLATQIDESIEKKLWWNKHALRSGAIWDDPAVCTNLLSYDESAHNGLLTAVQNLDRTIRDSPAPLSRALRRRLLVLTLLIAYLEERGVFGAKFFSRHLRGASTFFEVLGDAQALLGVLSTLQHKFNGNVFTLSESDRKQIAKSEHLHRFADLVRGHTDAGGQQTLWRLYSFGDLPVELASHMYQRFVEDDDTAVYTPPFLVRLMVDETLTDERLDRLIEREEVILDPACGSGLFLVEAYRRLVLHWRSKHQWREPDVKTLKLLAMRIHGVDLNPDAIELAAFSLSLAICDAVNPTALRKARHLLPNLSDSLHASCFFAAIETHRIDRVGIILGNPPFESSLRTPAARRAAKAFTETTNLKLPDNQVAYLFLHVCMQLARPGGLVCILQQYNFLYNKMSSGFRAWYFTNWNVREILDFISVRGMFMGAKKADTKVVAVVAEADSPKGSPILHAVFRRTGRALAKAGFDIDYYDIHWVAAHQARRGDAALWRANLLGGGRVHAFIEQLRGLPTLEDFVSARARQGWLVGEGFIEGKRGISNPADHIIGKRMLPSSALGPNGIDHDAIEWMPRKPIEGPRSEQNFTPPYLLIRETLDLHNILIVDEYKYLTYKNQIVGVKAPIEGMKELRKLHEWINSAIIPLRAYAIAISAKALTQHATTMTAADIKGLPVPKTGGFRLTKNEEIIAQDVLEHYVDFVRLGQNSDMLSCAASDAVTSTFSELFAAQINIMYGNLRPLSGYRWAGVICQAFVFGDGDIDWQGVEGLQERLDRLLGEVTGSGIHIHRIARIYDGPYLFLVKPDRLRYWIRSVALRDADETLVELRRQGF